MVRGGVELKDSVCRFHLFFFFFSFFFELVQVLDLVRIMGFGVAALQGGGFGVWFLGWGV